MLTTRYSHALFGFAFALSNLTQVESKQEYAEKLPCKAKTNYTFGHSDDSGTQLTSFGEKFQAVQFKWDKTLCMSNEIAKDAKMTGYNNGAFLGVCDCNDLSQLTNCDGISNTKPVCPQSGGENPPPVEPPNSPPVEPPNSPPVEPPNSPSAVPLNSPPVEPLNSPPVEPLNSTPEESPTNPGVPTPVQTSFSEFPTEPSVTSPSSDKCKAKRRR